MSSGQSIEETVGGIQSYTQATGLLQVKASRTLHTADVGRPCRIELSLKQTLDMILSEYGLKSSTKFFALASPQ